MSTATEDPTGAAAPTRLEDLGFDPAALRKTYREERDRRVRPEGNEQYVEVKGEFEHYLDDPHVESIEREPLFDKVEVVVIGGGFGGLLAGARLREAGVEDIRMIERGGDFGGTWYWNRYPGAQCDIESYVYLPLLEELGYMPVEKYSFAPEILAHSRAIGERFDLYRNACFQTSVTELRWDEEAARWIVSTNRGDAMQARFVIMANGPLDRPKLPGALKPWYRQFCKRPCFHDDYLPTFNRSNVSLVDTEGRGVERVTANGVIANGQEYEVDCLIYATGFEVGTDYTRRAGYELIGRDGITLSEKWKDGMSTLHGMHSHGFPNVFILSPAQSGFTANFPHSLNEQSKHVAYILEHALEQDVRTVEASGEAESEWVQTIIQLARLGRKFLEECTPGYYNNEGKPGERSGQNAPYGVGSPAFFKLLEDWRNKGTLEGLELTPRS